MATTLTQSLVITLSKKGNLQLCENYRTISLTSHPSKVMLKIILNRLQPQAEEIVAEEHAGFRGGRSTTKQIFSLRILGEKYLQHHHVFIDFKKAFDRVWHEGQGCLLSPTLFNIFLERIMCEALDDGEGSVSIGGRLITDFRFADDIVANAEGGRRSWRPGRPSRFNHHKVQNGDRLRQDTSDDKQPKWLPTRDQDKRSEARRSGELQVP